MWVVINRGPSDDLAPSYLRIDGKFNAWTAYPVDASTFATADEVMSMLRKRGLEDMNLWLDIYRDSLPCGCEHCYPEED